MSSWGSMLGVGALQRFPRGQLAAMVAAWTAVGCVGERGQDDAAGTDMGTTAAVSAGTAEAGSGGVTTSATGSASSGDGSESGASSDTGGSSLSCQGNPLAEPVFSDPEFSPGPGRLVAIADANGDNLLDAVLNEPGQGALLVLGTPAGAWGETIVIPGGPHLALALADLNGDDIPDLAGVSAEPFRVVVLAGGGAGDFSMSDEVELSGPVPINLAALDIEEDGDADIFVARDGDAVALLNDGGFATGTVLPVENASWVLGDLAVGDLDGLPGQDLVVHGTVVLFADGAGGFAETSTLNTPGGFVAAAQLDGVGPADLAIVSVLDAPAGFTSLSVALTDETGVGDLAEVFGFCEWCVRDKPSVFDVNGDVTEDIVYPSRDGVGIVLGCGDGTFVGPLQVDFGEPLRRVIATDVDDDGRADLIATTLGRPGELGVALGSG